jgi:hypothetical protein
VLQVIVKHHKTERSAGTLSFLIPADSILEELLIVYIEKVHLHKCGRVEEGKRRKKRERERQEIKRRKRTRKKKERRRKGEEAQKWKSVHP